MGLVPRGHGVTLGAHEYEAERAAHTALRETDKSCQWLKMDDTFNSLEIKKKQEKGE